MTDDFADECTIMRKLSDPVISGSFLKGIDDRLCADPENRSLLLARANVCRRAGQLSEARDSFRRLLELESSDCTAGLATKNVTPSQLTISENMTIAPIAVLDDFLDQPDLEQLLEYAQTNETNFSKAHVNSTDALYDPEKRETLVFRNFKKEKDRFEAFARSNVRWLSQNLGLPEFEISQVELKITNHVDGSFFKTHCDNYGTFDQAGRAITWLFYFGRQPPRYVGGDLYIFDTNLNNQRYTVQSFTKVIPTPNRLVAFPSYFRHAVSPMMLPGNIFGDGRFAVSGHISKKARPGFE